MPTSDRYHSGKVPITLPSAPPGMAASGHKGSEAGGAIVAGTMGLPQAEEMPALACVGTRMGTGMGTRMGTGGSHKPLAQCIHPSLISSRGAVRVGAGVRLISIHSAWREKKVET